MRKLKHPIREDENWVRVTTNDTLKLPENLPQKEFEKRLGKFLEEGEKEALKIKQSR